MAIAYFDCFSGIAGDMVLGALIDLGMPIKHLEAELSKVNIGSYKILKKRDHHGVAGTNLKVEVKSGPGSSSYSDLDTLIAKSRLGKPVRETAREILSRLAKAEGKVHRRRVEKVHFHEVGAVDSLVDIIGSAIGLDFFGFDAVYSSPLPMTRGKVSCEHGVLPVPAPAALELMKGVPLKNLDIDGEMVTPTGAAIITTVAAGFCECPLQVISSVGVGFGDKVFPDFPNVLRIMTGEGFPVVVLQSNIDDMNPELFDHAIERLFAAGALDVEMVPVQMKKNRPAVRLSVLCPWGIKDELIDLILNETSSFGVRFWPVDRKVLQRKMVTKKIKRLGVRFKVGMNADGKAIKAYPEYEDVKRFAKKFKIPIQEAYCALLSEARAVCLA